MRNGRRIFAPAFKSWLVERAGKPGMSVAGPTMKRGVNANQLRHWMRLQHLRGAPALPTLLPVTVSQVSSAARRCRRTRRS